MNNMLRTGDSLRQLATRCAPAWRQQLRRKYDCDADKHLLGLLQDMLWWALPDRTTYGYTHLTSTWEAHLDRKGLQRDVNVRPLIAEIWEGIREIVSDDLATSPISSYLHFWNPLTGARVTVPHHFHDRFAAHWASLSATRNRAWDLYRLLDARARMERPPLYTANQFLQQAQCPSDYSIHWGCTSEKGERLTSIFVDPLVTDRLAVALPSLRQLICPDELPGQPLRPVKDAAASLYDSFEILHALADPELSPAINRVRGLVRDQMRDEMTDRQALFILFGLAVNRQTLRCDNLYNFTAAYGRSCSIMSLTTEQMLGTEQVQGLRHIAHALLYPLMLGAFFDAKGEVEENLYCDLAHESEPVTVALTRIEWVRTNLTQQLAQRPETLVTHLDIGKSLLRFHNEQAKFIGSLYKLNHANIPSSLDTAEATAEILALVKEIAVCSPQVGPQLRDQLKNLDAASIHRADEKQLPMRFRQTSMEEPSVWDAVAQILEHHTRIEANLDPCRCLVHRSALSLILMNAIMNAFKWNDWREAVMGRPEADVIVNLTATGSKCGDGPTVSVSNWPSGKVEITEWVLPCRYEAWWREMGTGRRGGRIMQMALLHLCPGVPHDESSTWLDITCWKPFTVRLHLPSHSFFKRPSRFSNGS